MNVRKSTDYSALFAALSALMTVNLPQMELYREVGRLVSNRPERGAAVAAAEYLQGKYPDTAGFSPRNLRRMRDFYRTYESTPEIMADAMTVGWTQNIVILEAELTLQEKAWYIRVIQRFGWSKLELARQIASAAHLEPPPSTCRKKCATLRKTAAWSVQMMTRILRICYRNICRSPMDKFVMKYLVKKDGLEAQFHIESAGTSTEEIGDPVNPQAKRRLAEHGINCAGKTACQLTNSDYDKYDLLIGMDRTNLRNMHRIWGGDYEGKMHLPMDYTDHPRRCGGPVVHG